MFVRMPPKTRSRNQNEAEDRKKKKIDTKRETERNLEKEMRVIRENLYI